MPGFRAECPPSALLAASSAVAGKAAAPALDMNSKKAREKRKGEGSFSKPQAGPRDTTGGQVEDSLLLSWANRGKTGLVGFILIPSFPLSPQGKSYAQV